MSKGVKTQIKTLYLKAFYLNVGKYIEIINYYLSQKNEALPLGNYIKIFGGFAFKSTGYQKEGIPIIRISDFQNEQIVLENCKRYKEESSLEKYELKIGDIIIALTGGTIGKLAIVQEGLGKIYMNQRVGRFDILNPELFEKEYAYWIARGVQEKVKNLAWGGAQPNLSGKQIENMEFPIPEKSIQKKIIQFLNDLKNNSINVGVYFNRECEKEIIRLQNKQIALFQIKENTNTEEGLLQILHQQILQNAVSGKLTAGWRKKNTDVEPVSKLLEKIKAEKERLIAKKKIKKEKPLPKITEDEVPFKLPEKWEWCRLGDVGFTQTGTTPPTLDNDNFGNDIPFIKPADIKVSWQIDYENEKLSNKGLELGRLIQSGSVMMVCIGGSIGKSGICSMDVSCNQQINTITPLTNMSSWYIQYLLQSPYFQKIVWGRASGGTTPIVNKTKWETIPFPLPPFTEQKAIVAKVEKLMEHVSALEEKIKQNKQDAEMLMQSFLIETFKN